MYWNCISCLFHEYCITFEKSSDEVSSLFVWNVTSGSILYEALRDWGTPAVTHRLFMPIPTTNKETNATQKTSHGAPQRIDQRTRFIDWAEQSI